MGSLARIVGPIWATYALRLGKNEGEIVFLIISGFILFAFFLFLIFYKKMIPHPEYSENNNSELSLYIKNFILFDNDDVNEVVLMDEY